MKRSRVVPVAARQPLVHTLHPGDVVCAGRGERLETLLGSCVAIVLTDPRRTVGAMCHIVHSGPAARPALASTSAHGEKALSTMYGLLRQRAITPTLCEAFVFGGGNMFPGLFTGVHVGSDNAEWALQALAADGVRVLHHDLGGNAYRRLAWTVGPQPPQVHAVPV
jgi:chemotaxis protein CheD